MTAMPCINLTVINRNDGKVFQMIKEDVYIFSNVEGKKINISRHGKRYSIDIDYYQFFIPLAP